MPVLHALRSARTSLLSYFRPISEQISMPFGVFITRNASSSTFLDRDSVTERVLHVCRHFEKVDPAKVTPEASFQKDLGLDSLDTVEVVMAMEEEFSVEIPDEEADKISTAKEAIDYIASHPQAI